MKIPFINKEIKISIKDIPAHQSILQDTLLKNNPITIRFNRYDRLSLIKV